MHYFDSQECFGWVRCGMQFPRGTVNYLQSAICKQMSRPRMGSQGLNSARQLPYLIFYL